MDGHELPRIYDAGLISGRCSAPHRTTPKRGAAFQILSMNEPPPFPNSTNFDWDSIEPDECPDKFALEVFSSTLAWLITFCLSNSRSKKLPKTLEGDANLKAGYRRFVALVYVYRPDLLDGRTIASLSEELNVSRNSINKYIADISLEFKQQGLTQRDMADRAVYRASQLRARAERNKSRQVNKYSKQHGINKGDDATTDTDTL